MAFYLHTEYNWLALAPGDPGNVDTDTPSGPAISAERTTAFWDVFSALWSTNPNPRCQQDPDANAPLRHGMASDVGIGIDYQRSVRINPPIQHAQEEAADTARDMVEDMNDKIITDAGTISALQHAIEFLSRRQEEDQRQFHDDLAAKQVVIDSMAEQMADKDLAIMGLHRRAQATTLRHDEVLSTMRDEAAAKQGGIDELQSELDESAKEQAQQELELNALRQEVSQLKDANSELTSVNSTLKADLSKLADAVVQMFPGSDDEDNDEDNDDNGDDDDDPRDHHSTISPSPAPRTVSRIPRWTYLLKYPKKPLLTPTSLFPRVIEPDAALTPATMQPDAVVSSSPHISKFKIRPTDTFTGIPRRRLPLQKTPTRKFTSTSTNIRTRTSTITITTVSPKKAAKKALARTPFRF
ncbi:hypothetical protein BJ138DRAFT_304749 [Hygrophoropsis aurantiaca]|uniref:Uncharacterized protein n=1 Tax=Hygrophoropsis aurantiaca TaxID=72124 RepID=A0ACB8A6P0_9AGAM|nr:hypothetical protein BJ138DRAFT_304749 [Hygrophoropsis aurantiaca]